MRHRGTCNNYFSREFVMQLYLQAGEKNTSQTIFCVCDLFVDDGTTFGSF